MSTMSEKKEPVFQSLNAENQVTEVESVCMNCYKKGITRLMLTKIPFYKDVIISSFICEHCNYKDSGIESANTIKEKGTLINLFVKDKKDLDREIIKSDYATLEIPELDFEIPAKTQKSYLTTIEGIIERIKENIRSEIQLNKFETDIVLKLSQFLVRLENLKDLNFHIKINDPSGDSYIQNPYAPYKDDNIHVTYYKRNKEQNALLGLSNEDDENNDEMNDEIINFKDLCPNCGVLCDTNMKPTEIPYFKSVIVMCTVCDNCGHRSNEVKSGTGISAKGVKYILKLTDSSDLNRDILKSETASFEIPEIDFSMNEGTLGGKFTTIEGLLKDCIEQLTNTNPFFIGDSADNTYTSKMKEFIQKLEKVKNGDMLNVTVILDDPCGNSYLQNTYAPENDPNLEEIHYERSLDQNEWLGLNDMKLENY